MKLILFFLFTVLTNVNRSDIPCFPQRPKQIVSTTTIRDSIGIWLKNGRTSVSKQKSIAHYINTGKCYIQYYTGGAEEIDNSIYNVLNGSCMYITTQGKIKKCVEFLYLRDYIIDSKKMLYHFVSRPVKLTKRGKRKIEFLIKKYDPEYFIEALKTNDIIFCKDTSCVLYNLYPINKGGNVFIH